MPNNKTSNNKASNGKTNGYLVIIGGSVDLEGDRKILKQFVQLAGGRDARIVVLTVASGEPRAAGDDYRDAFDRLGMDRVEVIDTEEKEDANDSKYVDAIKNATGVFFTGGRQDRI